MRTKSRQTVSERAPTNFDEVRRRFIRQNRELAKNNSNQSLKIRSLELEVSRLLGVNLDLREEIIRLHNEAHQATSGRVSEDAVGRFRMDLQAKLAELSGMVESMDILAHDRDGEVQIGQRGRKPVAGNWRERQPLSEVMRENLMPTITEDKQYPRRTLGADDIQAIRLSDHSSNESPELGPPPVAHFDYEDPVKQISPFRYQEESQLIEEEELSATVSVNLETRRKRRDGQPKLEIRRHSLLAQSPKKADVEPSTILRTGAKRKLADRDLDKPIRADAKDDFSFSRKPNAPSTKPVPEMKTLSSDGTEQLNAHGVDITATPPKLTRKVLGDKSVNMSPRKVSASTEKTGKPMLEKPERMQISRANSASTRKRRTSAIPQPSPPPEEVTTAIELAPPPKQPSFELPPKTPTVLDFFSPTPSEPSVTRAFEDIRAGTPPPGDLSTLSTTADGSTRPSRRARAAVNYAEPSLISKMRRPGKQMVDALTGLQDPKRAIMPASERRSDSANSMRIKAEPADDSNDTPIWKSLSQAREEVGEEQQHAASPLSAKSASSDPLAAPPGQKPYPVASSAALNTAGKSPSWSTTSLPPTTISHHLRREAPQHHPDPDPTNLNPNISLVTKTREGEDLEIYDFNESPSPASSMASLSGGRTGASHRRHSSVPKTAFSLSTVPGKGEGEGEGAVKVVESRAGSGPRVVARSERAASRRRSMML
ncbi:hypothetical protein LTR62_007358 [Meristemomyces frigidus]|uniref:Shugoshin n=1 Tax=Meristemomyces frigidus TaxID=1508187 RepID=A0AAN7TV19_9PEZI|nr:hypothetical protein LTR62_007358 [Meristemomyces frigidus]